MERSHQRIEALLLKTIMKGLPQRMEDLLLKRIMGVLFQQIHDSRNWEATFWWVSEQIK